MSMPYSVDSQVGGIIFEYEQTVIYNIYIYI